MEMTIQPHDAALIPVTAVGSEERQRLISETVFTDEPLSQWTPAELDTAILALCDELPQPRMVACWRALEHCRLHTRRGTAAYLVAEMRHVLRTETVNQAESVLAARLAAIHAR